MTKIKNILTLVIIFLSPYVVLAESKPLDSIIKSQHREASSKRDQYRHPLETLTFFQIEKGQTVVEILPGGGAWYTEILAPYLRNNGTLYTAQYDPENLSASREKSLKKFYKKLEASPELYDQIKVSVFNPPHRYDMAPEGTADRVLTFRNLHHWVKNGDSKVIKTFKAFYDVLKKGGKLGVVSHRLPEIHKLNYKGGYVKQSYAIKLAEAAGFKLEASSEVNGNAKDSANHPEGVWTLPPSLELGDKDKEKYLEIGESDRMTLLFVKP